VKEGDAMSTEVPELNRYFVTFWKFCVLLLKHRHQILNSARSTKAAHHYVSNSSVWKMSRLRFSKTLQHTRQKNQEFLSYMTKKDFQKYIFKQYLQNRNRSILSNYQILPI